MEMPAPHFHTIASTAARFALLVATLLTAACAGPDARIAAPVPVTRPLPLMVARGAADSAEESRVIARALRDGDARHSDEALLDSLRKHIANSTLVTGNRVMLLSDGPSAFSEFARAIAAASHHIHVETFIFADDKLGRSFAELLAEKSREGVEVRVLYDGFGSWSSSDEIFERMRAAGVEVQTFHPLTSLDGVVSGRVNQRDHRKLLVVDGRVAFVGGINIRGTYNSASKRQPDQAQGLDDGWRDTQVRVTGPVVQQFQALFFASWAAAAGAPASASDAYFPRSAAEGPSLVAALASARDSANVAAIHNVYVAAANAAQRRLWITQAYFAPDRSLREALAAAARRGVDVRLLVPGFSDSLTVLNASRATYDELLADKVRIFEFDAAFVHAKTLLVDASVSLIGSANMDYRSAVDNNEITALIVDTAFAEQLAVAFLRDLTNASEVRLAQWRQRPLPQQVMERAATLLWRWL